jgi:hypothetical protein
MADYEYTKEYREKWRNVDQIADYEYAKEYREKWRNVDRIADPAVDLEKSKISGDHKHCEVLIGSDLFKWYILLN